MNESALAVADSPSLDGDDRHFGDPASGGHSVQFYRDDRSLTRAVAPFIRTGLERGDGVVVLATPTHLAAFREVLEADGFDVTASVAAGALILREARQVMSTFMAGELPDETAFRRAVTGLLAAAATAARTGRVRAYGEMVDVLWGEGKAAAVLRVEELWREIVGERSVELLCGYQLGGFTGGEYSSFFRDVCDRHEHVAPSEKFGHLSEAEKLRALAELEQRSLSLEAEVELRRRAETARERSLADAEQGRRDGELLLRLAEAANRAVALVDIFEPTLEAACAALKVERAAILLYDNDGVMRFKAWRGLSDEYRRAVEGHSPWSPEESNPLPIFIEDVTKDRDLSSYTALFSRERIGALAFVPLFQHGRLFGKFMVYASEPRSFSEREARLASMISGQVAQAVDRAQLLQLERAGRDRAEHVGIRTAQLQRVTAALATASSVKDVCDAVVREGLAALEGSTGGLWLVDESQAAADLMASVGYLATAAPMQRVVLDSPKVPLPIIDVIRAGEPVWLSSRAEFAEKYPQVAAIVVRPQIAIACLPLTVASRCIGGLAFTFDEVRAFGEDERNFLLVLARHCAQALERARLLDLERRARQRAEDSHARSAFLLEASVLLSASLDYRDALTNLAALAVSRVADWFAVELRLDPDRQSEQLVVAHADPSKVQLIRDLRKRYAPNPDAGHGLAHVIRTGKPELHAHLSVETLKELARDAEHLRILRTLSVHSVMYVPMVARGKTYGALTLAMSESSRTYTDADLEMAQLLGRRAGIAIDNALLYAEAQSATRAREEILAVVSHDLRNPIAAVLMGAGNLLRIELTDPYAPRIRKIAETVHRSAQHMSRLIDDLGDFSSIQSGRLAIKACPCRPAEIVDAAVELFVSQAQDRELNVETALGADLPTVQCDQHRLIQALGNLISNAVKVTAAGGLVRVGAKADGDEVLWFVEDTGPGIKADDLPHLFDRFWRGESAKYRGHGLGLTITKGIIEAHGGRIWVESAVGQGSRFWFTIPAAQP